jgi:hypothetical protein
MFIGYRAPQFTRLTKHKNDGGCRNSRSALAPSLQYRPNKDAGLVFSVTRKGPVHFGSSFLEASICGLRSNTRSPTLICFSFTFYLSMLSSHSDRIVSSRLLSCALALASL